MELGSEAENDFIIEILNRMQGGQCINTLSVSESKSVMISIAFEKLSELSLF